MKSIESISHIAYDSNKGKIFYEAVAEKIFNYQKQGLQVEVQYQMSSVGNASMVCYSTLIIGYKEV